MLEQRVQLAFQPVRIEVEHGIGKPFLGRRMPIVNLPGSSMNTLPGVLR